MKAAACALSLTALLMTGESGGNRLPITDESQRAKPALDACRMAGFARVTAGDYRGATAHFAGCLQQARGAGNRSYVSHFLTLLGNLSLLRHQYREAMLQYFEARDIAQQAGDRRQEGHIWANIASTYGENRAISEARSALDHAEAILPESDRAAQKPALLLQRARLEAWAGNESEATEIIRQAAQAADEQNNLPVRINAWDKLAVEHLRSRRAAEAGEAVREGFRLRLMHKDKALSSSYMRLAQVRLLEGRPEEALRFANLAIDSGRASNLEIPPHWLYYVRGQALRGVGRVREAYRDLHQALVSLRDLRAAALPSDRTRMTFGAALREVHAEFIAAAGELYFETGDPRFAVESFEIAEDNRAAALRSGLQGAGDLRNWFPPDYGEALTRLETLHARLFRQDDPRIRLEIDRQRILLTGMEVAAGGRLPAGLRMARIDRIQQRLRKDGAVLLSFHLNRENTQSWLWEVTPDSVRLHRLAPPAQIEAASWAFTAGIREGSSRAPEAGRRLHDLLFAAATAARDTPRWYLSPDESLYEVPFAALPVAGGSYLVQQHSVLLAPSAGFLVESPGAAWDGPMLAVGDPIYNVADPRWRSGTTRLAGIGNLVRSLFEPAPELELARLPGTSREIERSVRTWSGQGNITISGAEATEAGIRAALRRQPSVIHLATHLTPSPRDPRQVLLALSLRHPGTPELISADRIRTLSCSSALVVLSGCSSGRGELVAGEGVVGFARAWLQGGARAVAGTLWPTQDHSGDLLEAFYRQLRAFPAGSWRENMDRALQAAQNSMVMSGSWRGRPAYWSAYFLIGR